MFAVIQTGGKQYLVKTGDTLKIEKLAVEAGKAMVFDKVLLTANDDGAGVAVGHPYLDGVAVEAEVLEQGKADKIRVVKYKRKTRYRRVIGHRQPFTKIKVGAIK
ncbi:MAG: 50S ribosomal protein L21 [Patescibacteria group bacterium]